MNSGQYCFSLQPKIFIERIIGGFLLGHSPGGNSFALIKSARLCRYGFSNSAKLFPPRLCRISISQESRASKSGARLSLLAECVFVFIPCI